MFNVGIWYQRLGINDALQRTTSTYRKNPIFVCQGAAWHCISVQVSYYFYLVQRKKEQNYDNECDTRPFCFEDYRADLECASALPLGLCHPGSCAVRRAVGLVSLQLSVGLPMATAHNVPSTNLFPVCFFLLFTFCLFVSFSDLNVDACLHNVQCSSHRCIWNSSERYLHISCKTLL